MAELAASIIALIGVTKTIKSGVSFISSIKECPKEISNIANEHDSLTTALRSLGQLIDSAQGNDLNTAFTEQVRNVVGETSQTLNDLQLCITDLQPSALVGNGRRGALQIRFKYFLKERTIQVILARIQARRDALSLLLTMKSSADSHEIKRQLNEIQAGLENCLASIRSNSFDTESAPHTTPSCSESDISSHSRGGSSNDAAYTPEGSETSIETNALQVSSDYGRRFDRALETSRRSGPRGEKIQRLAQQFRGLQASDAAGAIARRPSQPCLPTSDKGKGKHSDEIRKLCKAEASAPGLWSSESAAAAQALGIAYRDADDLESALEYLHLALVGREATLGHSNLKTIEVLDQIAAVLEIQNRKVEALDFYQNALATREANPSIGTRHPTYVPASMRVARLTEELGHADEALHHLEGLSSECQKLPNSKGTTLMVRAEIAKLRLRQRKAKSDDVEVARCISEYQDLVSSRESNARIGSNDRRTQEAKRALEELEAAKQEASRQSTPEPRPEPTTGPRPGPDVVIIGPFGEKDLYMKELEQYEAMLAKLRAERGDTPATLMSMSNLADAYASCSLHEAAIGWYLECVKGYEAIWGNDHPTTLSVIHKLGESYLEHEDYSNAVKYLHQALAGRKRKLKRNHPEIFSTMTKLAHVYQALNDSQKAVEMIDAVMKGLQEQYDSADEIVVTAEFQRAKLLHKMGAIAEAEESYQRVIRLRLLRMEPDHPFILAPKKQLGLLLRDKGQFADAAALLEEAFAGNKVRFGEWNDRTVDTAFELASMYWTMEEYRKCINYYLIVLEGIQKSDPSDKLSGSTIMLNIGTAYVALEERVEALVWYEKVLKLFEIELGLHAERTVSTVLRIAHQRFNLDQYEAAIGHYHRVLRARETTTPDTDEEMMLILYQLFRATSSAGQNEKALAWSKRFLALNEHTELERRIIVMRGTGTIHAQNKDHSMAFDMYHRALADAKFLDDDHWLPSNIVHDIQQLMRQIDDDKFTMENLQRHRERFSQVLASNPEMGVRLLTQLGYIHARQDLHQDALNILVEALDAIQAFPDAGEYVELKHETIYGIADAHIKMYNPTSAKKYLQMLIDSTEDSSWRIAACVEKARILERENDMAEAVAIWTMIRREKERKVGVDHNDVLLATRRIGSLQHRQGNNVEAERCFLSAAAGFRRSQDSDAVVNEALTLELMTSIYLDKGDLFAALDNQKKCHGILKTELGADDERTASAELDVANIYQILGEEQEALQHYRRAVSVYRQKVGNRNGKVLQAEHAMRQLEGRSGIA